MGWGMEVWAQSALRHDPYTWGAEKPRHHPTCTVAALRTPLGQALPNLLPPPPALFIPAYRHDPFTWGAEDQRHHPTMTALRTPLIPALPPRLTTCHPLLLLPCVQAWPLHQG